MKFSLIPMTAQHRMSVMDIFNYYIENTFAAYPEHQLPYEFFDQLLKLCEGYPALVAQDEAGTVVGFGMLRAYHPMPVFSQTAEISYFLKPGFTGQGIGMQMLEYLVEKAKAGGITSILASISSLNEGSIKFHKKNGFAECGRFKRIGKKRGRAFDVVYMQKTL